MEQKNGLDQIPEDLRDCIVDLKSCLNNHVGLCNKLTGYLVNHPTCKDLREEQKELEGKVVYALLGLLQSVGSSSSTILKLSEDIGLHTKDCYSISRSIVETAINSCYLIAEGEHVADKMIKHAEAKSIEDLSRKSIIGDSEINLFSTDKEGNRIIDTDISTRAWTNKSVDKRIELIGSKLDKQILESLHWARFMVYRHSSEILHGTLFGSLYFSGMTDQMKENSPESFIHNIGQHHMMILMCSNFCIHSVIQSFHKKYGFKYLNDASEQFMGELKEIPIFKNR